jgi:hypothetical protein
MAHSDFEDACINLGVIIWKARVISVAKHVCLVFTCQTSDPQPLLDGTYLYVMVQPHSEI